MRTDGLSDRLSPYVGVEIWVASLVAIAVTTLVAPVVADIRAMLEAHPEIDTTQTLIVKVNRFAASSLDVMVCAIERHGARIVFPTQTLHMRQDGSHEPSPLAPSDSRGPG